MEIKLVSEFDKKNMTYTYYLIGEDKKKIENVQLSNVSIVNDDYIVELRVEKDSIVDIIK